MQITCRSYSLLEIHRTCVINVFSDCKNEGIFGNYSKIVLFLQISSLRSSIFKHVRLSDRIKKFNQRKLMISGHFSSFSCFMPVLVLAEGTVGLFCALSGFIMLLLPRNSWLILCTIWFYYVAATQSLIWTKSPTGTFPALISFLVPILN